MEVPTGQKAIGDLLALRLIPGAAVLTDKKAQE
jgi:hypothetical protein